MDENQLREFLKQHLRVEFDTDGGQSEYRLVVRLLLDDEEISRDTYLLESNDE